MSGDIFCVRSLQGHPDTQSSAAGVPQLCGHCGERLLVAANCDLSKELPGLLISILYIDPPNFVQNRSGISLPNLDQNKRQITTSRFRTGTDRIVSFFVCGTLEDNYFYRVINVVFM